MSWSDVEPESALAELIDETPKHLTIVSVHVNSVAAAEANEETETFSVVFKVSSFELFVNVRLPCLVKNKYNQEMVVHLSMHQKQMISDGLKVDFYPTSVGEALEILAIDDNQRKGLVAKVVDNVFSSMKSQPQPDQVTVIKFFDGDHGLISASAGFIKPEYVQVLSKDSVSQEPFYESIKSLDMPVVVISLEPKTEKRLSCAILSK